MPLSLLLHHFGKHSTDCRSSIVITSFLKTHMVLRLEGYFHPKYYHTFSSWSHRTYQQNLESPYFRICTVVLPLTIRTNAPVSHVHVIVQAAIPWRSTSGEFANVLMVVVAAAGLVFWFVGQSGMHLRIFSHMIVMCSVYLQWTSVIKLRDLFAPVHRCVFVIN